MADDYESLEWQCPKCTYINQKLKKNCLICEYENTDLARLKQKKPGPGNLLDKQTY